MNFLKLSPPVLSLILLGAHFFRARFIFAVIICIILIIFIFIKQNWAARLIQIGLMFGSIEWIRTLLFFAEKRQDAGEPWIRLAVILGVVALFTGLSALVFQSKSLKERYRLI